MNIPLHKKGIDDKILNLFNLLIDLYNATKEAPLQISIKELLFAYKVPFTAMTSQVLLSKGILKRTLSQEHIDNRKGVFYCYQWDTVPPTVYMTRAIIKECSLVFNTRYHQPPMIQLWPLNLKEIGLFH
jgi:hypothetical protein